MRIPVSTAGIGFNISPPTRRFFVFAAIAVGEIFLTSSFFGFPTGLTKWRDPVYYATSLAQLGIVAFLLFVLVAWPRRREILDAHSAAEVDCGWTWRLLANIALFSLLLLTKVALSNTSEPSFYALAAYCCLLLATGASLAFVAARPALWRRLLELAPAEIAVAGVGASLVLGASRLAQEGWSTLSVATLKLSHWILTLYEANVLLNNEQRILGVGNFRVQIYWSCSGYEGVGLIVACLAIYLWAFRRDLRFPNALLLFPLGIGAIWLLNAVRIAVLVSIGAHLSPAVAVEGFHSQGGWISFVVVTLSSIAISRKIPFFTARPVSGRVCTAAVGRKSGARASLEYLAPFMALMAASIVASAFAPHDQWLYALKVFAVGATLWWLRDAYVALVSSVSPMSIIVGIVAGVAWIATDPEAGAETALGAWLVSLPAWLAFVWLALRAFGSVVLVPLAEELAFRGYLQRALISFRFEDVDPRTFSWLAFTVTSLLFGLMHERWLAAALAGSLYAMLLYRSGRLSDPIAAHMATNGIIMGWAVAARQWSLI